LAVISWLSCPGCPVLVVLSWLSCPGCPVLVVLSWLSCPGCPVLVVLSWLSCPGSPVLVVLPWLSCPGCDGSAVKCLAETHSAKNVYLKTASTQHLIFTEIFQWRDVCSKIFWRNATPGRGNYVDCHSIKRFFTMCQLKNGTFLRHR
jgi:hypothetical protein